VKSLKNLLANRKRSLYQKAKHRFLKTLSTGSFRNKSIREQKKAVESGHYPLFRFNPLVAAEGKNPLKLDSKEPSISYEDYAYNELRYKMLSRTNPAEAERLLKLAQEAVYLRWSVYEEMATRSGDQFHPNAGPAH